MRTTRACLTVAAAVLVGVLATGAAPASAVPLPLPAAGPESLVTEGVTIEGPLVNNLNLPMLK
ncbi:hypothetical protein [Streptomyces curacoi]|uniref:Secreted protein n=1 Tax=Streptomyces curacoi TaxID=146536 RepID=A0A117P3F5_9ACTN|nr:hypothetical protein [Streptomyces curacoi]KUM72353.1 hypothetical protein AQI70_23945 [Streptomyces curacoi]